MIIVKLKGGLGNQLFQYATARRLAVFNNTELKLDILNYGLDGSAPDSHGRIYCLKHFNIVENIASVQEIDRLLKKGGILNRFNQIIDRKIKPYKFRTCLEERKNYFDSTLINLKLNKNVYLNGHWITEKYFKDIEGIIREELTVKYNPNKQNQNTLKKILESESVAMHIRRGDNVKHISSRNIYQVPKLEYYYKAINILKKNILNPHFFIFSDDIEWAMNNINIPNPKTFVTHNNDKTNYEDLRLISKCKYHITSNSTFSWWGAWLGSYPEQIVVIPKNWVKENYLYLQNKDLKPNNWIWI